MSESNRAKVCVLTGEGRGAISVIKAWGEDAVELTNSVFRPLVGDGLKETPVNRPRFGRIGAGLGDEVVVVRVHEAPDEIEVHCHGGHAARGIVLAAFLAAGAEERRPVAWVKSSAPSRIQAESEVDLMQATTLRTAEILLEQAQGKLEEEIARIASLIRQDHELGKSALDSLIVRGAQVGLRLIHGWRVSLAGRPNVGKSRLLNRLAGYDRAIVDPTPGTTRDVVTFRTAFDGWPVELSDTAGIREAGDVIERSGIELSRAQHQESDLAIVVLDLSRPLADADRDLIDQQDQPIIVANKCDLPHDWSPPPGCIAISAERGDGIEQFVAHIVTRLVPNAPSPGAAIPFRRIHLQVLSEAQLLLYRDEGQEAARRLETLLRPS